MEEKQKEQKKNENKKENKTTSKPKTKNTNKNQIENKKSPNKNTKNTETTAKKTTTSKNTVSKKKDTKSNVKPNTKENTKKVDTDKKERKRVNKKEQEEYENIIAQIENVSEQVERYEKTKDSALIDSNKINETELKTIKEEIKKNKKDKKSTEEKQQKYKEILKNLLICMFIFIYIIALIIGSKTLGAIKYITNLKTFIMVEVLISIFIFENSYSKDNFLIGLHGIELLTVSGLTILLLDLFNKQSEFLSLAFAIITGIVLIYYLIKVLVIAIKKNKNNK